MDATVFTEAGYVGEDVESILPVSFQVCNHDVAAAERGIVYIDEIDKISRRPITHLSPAMCPVKVQQAPLKMLEGTEVYVPPQGGRKHPEQKMVKINTQNIPSSFCGGAFDGIQKIIARRTSTQLIGFKKGRRSCG